MVVPKEDKKKRHNLMLADSAWQFLKWLQKNKFVKSHSSAIEFLIDYYKKSKKN